jgi:hypothetical protein
LSERLGECKVSLRGSVRRTGAAGNNGDDVKLVQRLLNSVLMPKTVKPAAGSSALLALDAIPPFAPLRTGGEIGAKTVAAIVWFQKNVLGLQKPDGVVKPGGTTIGTLENPPVGLNVSAIVD